MGLSVCVFLSLKWVEGGARFGPGPSVSKLGVHPDLGMCTLTKNWGTCVCSPKLPFAHSQTSGFSGKSAGKHSDLEILLAPFLKSTVAFTFILLPLLEASALRGWFP